LKDKKKPKKKASPNRRAPKPARESSPAVLPFLLNSPYITLAHAVKAVGLTGTGGQAKFMVRQGLVSVNGEPEIRPGRKLIAADRFGTSEQAWILEQSTDAAEPDFLSEENI
jgi:ribosome-associated protein